MTTLLAAAALAAALALAACQPAGGDDAAFDARVKAYLMAHPEVLQAALQKMQAKDDADEAKAQDAADAKAEAALPALRAALERDPRDFVANPNGKVTVTEFYDYRCPHCIEIAPQVVGLIRTQPDVRFVFKEMPIFGDASEPRRAGGHRGQEPGQGLRRALRGLHVGPPADGRRRRPDRHRQGGRSGAC